MFEHLLSQITEPDEVEAVDQNEIGEWLKEFPNLPDDYLQFMREVGWGDVGGLMIYSGPVPPEDMYSTITPASAKIALFGDDWQGTCYGFDLEEGCMIEVSPRGEVERMESDFKSFIPQYVN